jgi:hypothetical protein
LETFHSLLNARVEPSSHGYNPLTTCLISQGTLRDIFLRPGLSPSIV